VKVLVTGGTGVVGTAAVMCLLRSGHEARLLSRHAVRDCDQWVRGVEPREGTVSDPGQVKGAADGCDAVLHIAGIVAESPPDVTFESVNVNGTRNVIAEAERAGARRFVFVSSLGADRGTSAYHRSKRAAEALVEAMDADWVICRPGNVYGPGDEVISLILRMVRTLPAVPVIDDGRQPFQPIWAEDAGSALVRAVEREDLSRVVLELAGAETTCMSDLLDRLERLTGRTPLRVPLPGWLASAGVSLASTLGVETPATIDQITMLLEENVIADGKENALTDVLGVEPTPLAEGLAVLVDVVPEQLPDEGFGPLRLRRYWTTIAGTRLTASQLLARVRERFAELVPRASMDLDVEPGTPSGVEEGATLTIALPMRGTIQVRVEELTDNAFTCVTLEGHPMAGAITFHAEELADALRFEVRTVDRPATVPDLLALSTVGRVLKHRTWQRFIENVIHESGGTAPNGIYRTSAALDASESQRMEEWMRGLVMARKRKEGAGRVRGDESGVSDHEQG
jgi:NADH dehydrogenase